MYTATINGNNVRIVELNGKYAIFSINDAFLGQLGIDTCQGFRALTHARVEGYRFMGRPVANPLACKLAIEYPMVRTAPGNARRVEVTDLVRVG